jgi:hypothetical protein
MTTTKRNACYCKECYNVWKQHVVNLAHLLTSLCNYSLQPSTLTSTTVSTLSTLLAISSTVPTSTANPTPEIYAGWAVSSGGRGTIDIIWKCFPALAFCCWTSLHLNIPYPNEPSLSRILRKLKWAVTAIIIPEFILTLAIAQRSDAKDTLTKLKDNDACKDWHLRHAFFFYQYGRPEN